MICPHALVVDDNHANREVARLLLGRNGWTVSTVASGGAALATHERHDLVLMDIQMPAMCGAETACRMRARETPGHRPPIFALTAYHTPRLVKAYRAQGLDATLGKPLSIEALREKLATYRMPVTFGPGMTSAILLEVARDVRECRLERAHDAALNAGCTALARRISETGHAGTWRDAAMANVRRELDFVIDALRERRARISDARAGELRVPVEMRR